MVKIIYTDPIVSNTNDNNMDYKIKMIHDDNNTKISTFTHKDIKISPTTVELFDKVNNDDKNNIMISQKNNRKYETNKGKFYFFLSFVVFLSNSTILLQLSMLI